jgi:hypothetical protein
MYQYRTVKKSDSCHDTASADDYACNTNQGREIHDTGSIEDFPITDRSLVLSPLLRVTRRNERLYQYWAVWNVTAIT